MFTENDLDHNVSMTIAGLDPSGGAGLLADCKTFNAHNIYATSVATTITAQNPFNITDVVSLDTRIIEEQIDAIMDVYPIKYMKTGVLYTSSIVKLVAQKIKEYQLRAVVDPVMIAESGANLTDDSYVNSLKRYLLKQAYVITPNIFEAEKISNKTITTEEDMISVADHISKYTNVVITGGHMNGNDILVYDDKLEKIVTGSLIDSKNTHGTGCNYSASLTSNLVLGNNMVDSCRLSNEYIRKSIQEGFYNTPSPFWKKED
ncbi:MAG: bifunctional hydroxymethylpyrimidine kinase/phosphomethylpyrimidine kinase [Methanosphaera sp.]|nr:bifunctional hydroxymethylpyrimidine kinase/phosphomethylpyrimidine kinase [Methanosphaera sp.]